MTRPSGIGSAGADNPFEIRLLAGAGGVDDVGVAGVDDVGASGADDAGAGNVDDVVAPKPD